jgi:hypothetical protein
MNEQHFLNTIHTKALQLQLNPLLLLSGIEGLYTFRDLPLNPTNAGLLDSLILSIFALRIGDQFHTLAQENLHSTDLQTSLAAERELTEMSTEQIGTSDNPYLKSFASLLQGKSVVRHYHVKALEVAALEIRRTHLLYGSESIGTIMLQVCKSELQESLDLDRLFNAS